MNRLIFRSRSLTRRSRSSTSNTSISSIGLLVFDNTFVCRREICDDCDQIIRSRLSSSFSTRSSAPRHLAKGTPFPPLADGVLRFYNMQFCPFAERTKLVLEYKKIPYETINVDLKYKPDWFLRRNPLGLVPVLEQGDVIICESTATCEWVDDIYPEKRLQPMDPFRKAWDRQLLEYYDQMISKFMTLMKVETAPSNSRDKLVYKIKKDFSYFEKVLTKRNSPFFGGELPAMIDFYLWPHLIRVPASAAYVEPSLTMTESAYPKMAAWLDLMYTLPAVKVSTCDIDAYQHFVQTLLKGNPDFDYGL